MIQKLKLANTKCCRQKIEINDPNRIQSNEGQNDQKSLKSLHIVPNVDSQVNKTENIVHVPTSLHKS